MQRTHTTQHQKNNPIKKWADDLNRHLIFQRRHIDGQQEHEKMLNITMHQG